MLRDPNWCIYRVEDVHNLGVADIKQRTQLTTNEHPLRIYRLPS